MLTNLRMDVRLAITWLLCGIIPALFLPDGRNAKKLNKFRGFLMISGTAPSLDRSLTRCKCYLHLQDAEGQTPWVFFFASLGWFGGFPLGW